MDQELKSLHIWIPADLHKCLKKLSAEKEISITQIIIQYLRYLKKNQKTKVMLYEDSEETFELLKKSFM